MLDSNDDCLLPSSYFTQLFYFKPVLPFIRDQRLYHLSLLTTAFSIMPALVDLPRELLDKILIVVIEARNSTAMPSIKAIEQNFTM